MKSNLIDIEARLVHETERAWLLDTGETEPTWIPKSAAASRREIEKLRADKAVLLTDLKRMRGVLK